MCPVVDLCKVLPVQSGVDLSGRQVGMPKKFLDGTQFPAILQQMGRERMPKSMRVEVDRQAGTPGPLRYPKLDPARRQAPAASPDEQCMLPLYAEMPAFGEPCIDGFSSLSANRYDPNFPPLPKNTQLVRHRSAWNIERPQFGKAHAGRVQQLDHCMITKRPRGMALFILIESADQSVGFYTVRQRPLSLGWPDSLSGIG